MNNVLRFDEFIRSLSISKNDTFSMLLGAGCSVSSGIPSAGDCIWDWKKIIYKSNNPLTKNWIENSKNGKVQEIIQKWLDNQGQFLERDSPEEYSFYALRCFPIEENRRQYFQSICTNISPSIGYKSIPFLVKKGFLDSVWTTNFDDLVYHSCVLGKVQGIEISLDSVQRINQRTQTRNELPIIKLHGDFKYGDLKNTSQELKDQEEIFKNKLIDYLGDKHLIVFGYSGRDNSLMETLKIAYSKPGGGMLFWCGYGNNISEEVEDLLKYAHKNNRRAFYVPTDGFDSSMIHITKTVIEDTPELNKEFLAVQSPESLHTHFTPFDLKPGKFNKILKSNCFPFKFPEEVFVFEVNFEEEAWKFVDDRTKSRTDISAIPYDNTIWAFSTLETIREVFGDSIIGDILRKPIAGKIQHSRISSLLVSTLCKLFAEQKKLNTDFKNKLWLNNYKTIANEKVFEAIKLSLEQINGKYYICLNPAFKTENDEISPEINQQIGLVFYHRIWNNIYNEYIETWRKILTKESPLEYPFKSSVGFYFSVGKAPIFTNISDFNNPSPLKHNVPPKLLELRGVQFKESALVFSTKNGEKRAYDTHPMRGLVEHKPYETHLETFLGKTIHLGVISPELDAPILRTFLLRQNSRIPKNNPKDNYVIDFEGFYNTYGISLNIPDISSSNWKTFKEPNSKSYKEKVHEIKTLICNKINEISGSGNQQVMVIYIPERWENYTSYREEGESFDLHDYVKAFCVEKGITSQFIREKTIKDQQQSCQINWWLSLSYYVKSLRTPWILKDTDKQTAFAGIGYSVNKKIDNESHIVLGCSHIYSSTGEGLKYKLSKISNDKIQWKRRKPHLSYDDAYEFGLNVLSLFFDSMNEIPKRVVIHKRTFYTQEEKQGLLDSLYDNSKIDSVDLIEINFEKDIRYVSSKILDGKATIDGFSVSRGTCIQLNSHEALLWAHGVIPSVKNPNYNFYPGGRYIPKPLRVTKHHGTGSLEQISNEILGLTKMNWNSLNMYSQLPATISSSNDIARIGKLIQSREKIEYDYRYFI